MKSAAVLMLSMLVLFGCSQSSRYGSSPSPTSDSNANSTAATASSTAPDNSGRNALDTAASKTAGDQAENEADRKITQDIRKAIVDDDSLSTNGKNVKVITINGTVTLRGPVKSEQEKTSIEAKAQQIAGVKQVDNQLEVVIN